MTASEREDRLRKEKAKALVRDLHLSELKAAGAARALAMHRADQELDRIARLLPDALDGGLSLAEIARITNVSRPTLYELRARYGGTAGDLRFAVLQILATRGPVWEHEVIERLAGRDGISAVLADFVREELTDVEVGMWDQHGRDTGPGFELTAKGFETLENWTFALYEEGEGGK